MCASANPPARALRFSDRSGRRGERGHGAGEALSEVRERSGALLGTGEESASVRRRRGSDLRLAWSAVLSAQMPASSKDSGETPRGLCFSRANGGGTSPGAPQTALAAAASTCCSVGTPSARNTSVPSAALTITVGVERMPSASASSIERATSRSVTDSRGAMRAASARTARVCVQGWQNAEVYRMRATPAVTGGPTAGVASTRSSVRPANFRRPVGEAPPHAARSAPGRPTIVL